MEKALSTDRKSQLGYCGGSLPSRWAHELATAKSNHAPSLLLPPSNPCFIERRLLHAPHEKLHQVRGIIISLAQCLPRLAAMCLSSLVTTFYPINSSADDCQLTTPLSDLCFTVHMGRSIILIFGAQICVVQLVDSVLGKAKHGRRTGI